MTSWPRAAGAPLKMSPIKMAVLDLMTSRPQRNPPSEERSDYRLARSTGRVTSRSQARRPDHQWPNQPRIATPAGGCPTAKGCLLNTIASNRAQGLAACVEQRPQIQKIHCLQTGSRALAGLTERRATAAV